MNLSLVNSNLLVIVAFIYSVLIIPPSSALFFKLPVKTEKCLKDEVKRDILVTGQYNIQIINNIIVNLKVIDSKSHVLYQKESASDGKFAFTLDVNDVFTICFSSDYAPNAQYNKKSQITSDIEINLKRGVEAKNYDELAKAEQLKPLELNMRKLEDLTLSVFNDFTLMKKRGEDMRDMNLSTNSRVLYFSIFSMSCLIFLATWQIFYLKKYFKNKKLID